MSTTNNSTPYVRKDGKLVKKSNHSFEAATRSILASLFCIVIGLAVGLIILVCISPENAFDKGFLTIIKGGFNLFPQSKRNLGNEIAQTAPLIMTGLSVAFAFKTGLFNIGAAGQYTAGAFGSLYCALVFGWPWYICLLVAIVFGAAWGAIPGLLKAFFNVNEVITSIMFNWIALYLTNDILKTDFYGTATNAETNKGLLYDILHNKTFKVTDDSLIPNLGMKDYFKSSTTIAIFIAIIIAVLIYIIINKTTFGYELKACGHNKNAAKYAGINEKRNIVLSMVIAGALAGAGAGLYYLSGAAEWDPNNSTALPAMGFNGIPVALLALSNPIGVIFSALFITHITIGGGCLPTDVFQPEVADVIVGVIVYLCAFVMLFSTVIGKIFKSKSTENANAEPAQTNKQATKNANVEGSATDVKGDAE